MNIDFVEIESIEDSVEDDAYDIINYEALAGKAFHNEGHFLVDGIIVHNCIPEYVKRRDDTQKTWKTAEHPEIAAELSDTYGLIIYQEQLAAIWRKFAGFTAVEAEAARKAVAKKWVDKLKPVKQKWIDGCANTLGSEFAARYWDDKIAPFASYAFNRCLAGGTTLIDCVTGESRIIENAAGMTLQSSVGPDTVKAIHFNGCRDVYRVKFSNGVHEDVTIGHKYLTDNGFKTVGELIISAHSPKICGILQSRCEAIDAQASPGLQFTTSGAGHNIQQISCAQIGGVRDWPGEERERNLHSTTVSSGFCEGIYGWGWHNCDKREGVPNGRLRGKPNVGGTNEAADNGECDWAARQQNVKDKTYTKLMQDLLDRLGSMQENPRVVVPKSLPKYVKKAEDSRIHIESIEYVGTKPVYSPEMTGQQHDYSIGPGHPIAANSHSCSYILVAYWCAWLKSHFPPEWWAAVMSGCHSDRIPRYMNTARLEGVQFGPIDAENLTRDFSVSPDLRVTPGLISIKGIGNKAASKLEGKRQYRDIDDFVRLNGKAKTVMEPLIKLGAFSKWHKNIRATWMWYLYKYCSGKDITKFRREVDERLLAHWTPEKIAEQRKRFAEDFKKRYPRRKVPPRWANWKPQPDRTRENVMALFPDDFSLKEQLEFEKQYLGYYWHSPLDLYEPRGGKTILGVKKSASKRGKIECVVEGLQKTKTKTGSRMGRLRVTDGLSDCTIILWAKQLEVLSPLLKEGRGYSIHVNYDPSRDSFTLASAVTVPVPLDYKAEFRNAEFDG